MEKLCPNCRSENVEEVAESGEWFWTCYDCEEEWEDEDESK